MKAGSSRSLSRSDRARGDEILRRAPAWLQILAGVAASFLIFLVIAYFWWIAGGLAAIALWRLVGLRIVRQRS